MIVSAGRDSSSIMLTFVVYLMAMHPEVMIRLRQEILDKVGPTRMPNQSDIKYLTYLRAVINGACL
jgi:cytochrome P450